MRPVQKIGLEGVVVGIIFAIIYAGVQKTGVQGPTMNAFWSGLLGHLAFEAAGLNRMFCEYRNYNRK